MQFQQSGDEFGDFGSFGNYGGFSGGFGSGEPEPGEEEEQENGSLIFEWLAFLLIDSFFDSANNDYVNTFSPISGPIGINFGGGAPTAGGGGEGPNGPSAPEDVEEEGLTDCTLESADGHSITTSLNNQYTLEDADNNALLSNLLDFNSTVDPNITVTTELNGQEYTWSLRDIFSIESSSLILSSGELNAVARTTSFVSSFHSMVIDNAEVSSLAGSEGISYSEALFDVFAHEMMHVYAARTNSDITLNEDDVDHQSAFNSTASQIIEIVKALAEEQGVDLSDDSVEHCDNAS